jgi:hypothetical protein
MNRMFMVRVQFIKEQEATNMPRLRRSTLTHSARIPDGQSTRLLTGRRPERVGFLLVENAWPLARSSSCECSYPTDSWAGFIPRDISIQPSVDASAATLGRMISSVWDEKRPRQAKRLLLDICGPSCKRNLEFNG